MRFVASELFGYGILGFTYDTVGGAILSYLITILFTILAIIGAVVTIKWAIQRKAKKKKYSWQR